MDLVLSVAVAGIIFGVATNVLHNQAQNYAFIKNRQVAAGDLRQALHLIKEELIKIETADIQDISSTKIEYVDETGSNTSFKLVTDGDKKHIYKGTYDKLLVDVAEFELTYYDANGLELSLLPDDIANSITSLQRIDVKIVLNAKGSGGTLKATTIIIPRVFLGYSNYQ